MTFWDTLNRDSNLAQPYFARLAEDFEGTGTRFAAIYIGDPPKDAESVPYAVVVDSDGSLASVYNVKRVSRIFVISDGQVYVVQNTFLPENYELIKDALKELLPPTEEAPKGNDRTA